MGLVALILGYIAKGQIARTDEEGSGMATAGIVLGWLEMIGAIILIVALVNAAQNS